MAGLRGTPGRASSRRARLLLLAAAASPPPSGSSGLRGSLRGRGAAGGPGLASGGLWVLLHFSHSTWRGRRRMGRAAPRAATSAAVYGPALYFTRRRGAWGPE